MINFDDVTKENVYRNPSWPKIPDHPHRILIIGSSQSGESKEQLKFVCQEIDNDIIYLYAKDPYEAKYQLIIKKTQKFRFKGF